MQIPHINVLVVGDVVAHETYAYTLQEDRGVIIWDITLAKTIVAQGDLHLEEVDRVQQRHISENYEVIEAKVQAADISTPGIAAPFIWQGSPDLAPQGIVHILIDGIHRAVRAYRDRQPFYAYVLSHAQSRACLISGPPEVIP